MSRVRLWQFGLIAGAFLLLEILCRTRIINPFTMIPPTEMVVGLFEAAVNKPWFWPDVSYTLFNIAAAVAISIVGLRDWPGLACDPAPALRDRPDPYFVLCGADFHPLSAADRVLRHWPAVVNRDGCVVRHRRHGSRDAGGA